MWANYKFEDYFQIGIGKALKGSSGFTKEFTDQERHVEKIASFCNVTLVRVWAAESVCGGR